MASTAALPRPAERTAIVTLLLVFLCGMVAGAVVMSVSGHASLHRTRAVPSGYSLSVDEWKSTLDLTDEQTAELTSILDDFARYYDNVLADGNSRILQILKPAQRIKFEQMIRDHKR